MIKKTKVFKSGNSLAVRIPKEYDIGVKDVYIKKQGDNLIIYPTKDKWDLLEDLLSQLKKDDLERFLDDRNQPKTQERDLF